MDAFTDQNSKSSAKRLVTSWLHPRVYMLLTGLDSDKPHSFREWARGYFDIEHGRLRSADATILILLPIASAAIGMMAFGIEFQIVEHLASNK